MKILVRITGEMMIKSSPVSRRFQRHLRQNLRIALQKENIVCKVDGQWARLWLESEDPRILDVLKRIFGVHAISLIEHECKSDLDTIVDEGERFYKSKIAGKTFAVQSHRVGKHPYTSVEVNIALGARLNRGNEVSKVKLKNPETTVRIEIRDENAYFYRENVKGIGGLPVGSAGSCVSLVSGGFDSTVASWMMQKRGLKLHYLFCNLGGEAYERSVLRVMTSFVQRWAYGDPARIHIVDFQPIVAEILKKVHKPFSQVILKRMFYRVAEMLMHEAKAHGCVTGEVISQVSSQTLQNLEAISTSIRAPIYRPLISMDKGDIIQMARDIGVYQDCAQIKEYCQIVPQKPVTACSIAKAEEEESYLDLEILNTQFAQRKILNLWELHSEDLRSSYVFKEEIPEGAIVIDCQSQELYDAFHFESAVHWDFYDLLAQYGTLAKDKRYLIYCTFGTQSAVLAEKMQSDGYEAFSLRGGVKSLNRPA